MTAHFSFSNLVRKAIGADKDWPQQWAKPEPKSDYDVIIIGAGGHGLGAAYYLAREHGITNVAVVEKGWLGGGNTARNTTIIRSNYLYDESAALYDHALNLWEGLSQDINYNVMFSQRGAFVIQIIGLGVAFHGSVSLREQANACIDHNDLTALLYIQGYRKSQFVLS